MSRFEQMIKGLESLDVGSDEIISNKGNRVLDLLTRKELFTLSRFFKIRTQGLRSRMYQSTNPKWFEFADKSYSDHH